MILRSSDYYAVVSCFQPFLSILIVPTQRAIGFGKEEKKTVILLSVLYESLLSRIRQIEDEKVVTKLTKKTIFTRAKDKIKTRCRYE